MKFGHQEKWEHDATRGGILNQDYPTNNWRWIPSTNHRTVATIWKEGRDTMLTHQI